MQVNINHHPSSGTLQTTNYPAGGFGSDSAQCIWEFVTDSENIGIQFVFEAADSAQSEIMMESLLLETEKSGGQLFRNQIKDLTEIKLATRSNTLILDGFSQGYSVNYTTFDGI